MSELTQTTFAEVIHSRFKIGYKPDLVLEVELIDVREGVSSPRQEAFSITFRGPGEPLLEQRIYPFKHEHIGRFELFIVPIGKDEDGIYYEAVFNRLIKKEDDRVQSIRR